MNKQDGFSLVEGLLIFIVIGIMGFAGYYVWNQQKNDSSENNNSEQQSITNESASNIPNESSENQNDSEVQSVAISELGLKVNDPENRKITLKVIDVESPDGESKKYYTLTAEKYTQDFNANCETAGYVIPVSKEDKSSYESTGFLKTIDGNYYFVGGTIGGCGDDMTGWDSYVREYKQYLYDNLTAQ